MWVCKKCQSEVEENFFACWNCSTPKPGTGDHLEWFTTESPALLAIPESLVEAWDGFNPSAPGLPSRDLEKVEKALDAWVSTIEVGNGQALILGGHPTDATFQVHNNRLCILRWLCGDSAVDILDLIHSQLSSATATTRVPFLHTGGRLLLIGAGDCGADLEYEPVSAELAEGSYAVDTFILKKPRTEVAIHRFEQAPKS